MRTIRRLIYREVLAAVGFVTVGFLALFFFFDFVDELPNVGKGSSGYKLTQALTYVMLLIPNHMYELLPIAVPCTLAPALSHSLVLTTIRRIALVFNPPQRPLSDVTRITQTFLISLRFCRKACL